MINEPLFQNLLKCVPFHRSIISSIIKRNANAFSLSAIVDVRRRRLRQEMIFKISLEHY